MFDMVVNTPPDSICNMIKSANLAIFSCPKYVIPQKWILDRLLHK